MQRGSTLGRIAFALLAWSASAGATSLAAQIDPYPNAPQPDTGRQVVPFMEGWYDNGDGTYTISFGYLNRNANEDIDIPLGERNYIEPAQYDGNQPTHFMGSRQRGMFGITIPESARDTDIWWYITPSNGQTYKVPGRTSANAYQLDWYPRPHGSVTPLMWFDSESDAGRGPQGVWASRTLTTSVGRPLTLTVQVNDPSERDPTDRRFAEPIGVRVEWSLYQGPPGEVTFARDPSMPEPAGRGGRGGFGGRGGAPDPSQVTLDDVRGTVRVIATFSTPGEYVIMAKADNFGAPDSADGDQCCWSNAYQRVTVRP